MKLIARVRVHMSSTLLEALESDGRVGIPIETRLTAPLVGMGAAFAKSSLRAVFWKNPNKRWLASPRFVAKATILGGLGTFVASSALTLMTKLEITPATSAFTPEIEMAARIGVGSLILTLASPFTWAVVLGFHFLDHHPRFMPFRKDDALTAIRISDFPLQASHLVKTILREDR